MTFISRISYFQIISEVLNSQMSICVVFMAYCGSLLARTLNSRGKEFANTCENNVLVNISLLTLLRSRVC